MVFKISLYCQCCGQKLKTSPYYAFSNDPTVFNVQPCKGGCSEAGMLRKIKKAEKERTRRETISCPPMFGDHLESFR
uniref:Uncharacterized protein n=1 Tax=viral metagenome TaxID=1070528 RepID=A0A6M3KST5_9ZZZZ